MNDSLSVDLESDSAACTQAIGRALGAALGPGDVVGLVGPLGAGKTMLAKGIAAGAGVVDPRRVTSPTFVLVNEYEGRLRLHHIDAYRLHDERELDALGFDEFAEHGAVVVEWADRVAAAMPAGSLTITITPAGDTRRTLHCEAGSERAAALARAMAARQ